MLVLRCTTHLGLMPTSLATSQGINSAKDSSKTKTSRYRPEIDGLRAFAVVAVIINHFNKDILPGGYLGVDIFFVISGYVITSSLFGRSSKDFKDFISGFYERRIKRLVPALAVFVLITSIAVCLFIPDPGIQLGIGKRALFGFSNIALYNQSTDYFAQSTELNVFTHTWSLGVEEQFYILFPFLVWFSGFGRQTKNGARNLFLVVGALTIASLVGFLYLYPTNQPAAYFLMPYRFWEMAAGCLIFIGFQKRGSIEQLLEKVPPLLMVAMIVGVMYLPMSLAAASTIAVVALSSILIACLKRQTAVFEVFTNPKVVYIGLISYSLYLWHWGVLSISRWTIGIHWWSAPFQIALMLGLAVASYRWIETPLRKGNWLGKRWKNLTAGMGTLIISALSITLIPRTPLKDQLVSVGEEIYPPQHYIKPGIPQSDLYCHHPQIIENAFQDCLTPPAENGKGNNIFLVGDSHATNHHWSISNALEQTKSKFGLNTLAEYGLIYYLGGDPGCGYQSRHCIKDAGIAYEKFLRENLKPGDYLLVGLARDMFTIGDFDGSPRKQSDKALQALRNGLITFSRIAQQNEATLVLIGDIPKVCTFDVNYRHEVVRLGKTQRCTVDVATSIEDRIGLNNVLIEIANKSPSTIFVDPHNELCDKDQCSAINRAGVVMYSDKSPHFSKDSKDLLTEYWVKTIIALGIAGDLQNSAR